MWYWLGASLRLHDLFPGHYLTLLSAHMKLPSTVDHLESDVKTVSSASYRGLLSTTEKDFHTKQATYVPKLGT